MTRKCLGLALSGLLAGYAAFMRLGSVLIGQLLVPQSLVNRGAKAAASRTSGPEWRNNNPAAAVVWKRGR